MEETENNTMLDFEAPKELPTFIKVIGVGGGGGNAVNHMFREGIQGVDFIVCNTDSQALQSSPVPVKIALGKGLGAGSKPERAKEAALEKSDEIRELLSHNTQMLFITAGMGGGTGTGAAPVIAEIAKSIELEDADTSRILVVAIVTMPFSFEGRRRREQAEKGIEELRKHVDSILVINNDKLRAFGDMTINTAFSKADDVLLTAAKGIAEIITVTSYVNVDFQDVNTVMENSGTALMGAGVGKGENRAMDAIKAASSSVLLNDDNIRGAKYVLLYFLCSPDHMMRMDEVEAVTTYLSDLTGPDSEEVIWGMGASDSLDDEIKITLIATGFEKKDHMDAPISAVPVNIQTLDDSSDSGVTTKEVPTNEITEPTIVHVDTATTSTTAATPAASTTTTTATGTHHTLDEDEQRYTEIIDKANVGVDESLNSKGGHTYVLQMEQTEAETAVADEKPQDEPNQGIYLKQKDENKAKEKEPELVSIPHFENPITSNDQHIDTPTLSDTETLSRAERIKRMHDLLCNNPNGPLMVEQMRMTPDESAFESSKSNNSEANRSVVDASGAIVTKNSFLFDQPD